MNKDVAAAFAASPPKVRAKLKLLRRLILEVAAQTAGVGPLEETLKWGQPSYLTSRSGSGSTIRIDRLKSKDGGYAMYFHCQTGLVDGFRERYRDELRFEGNRAIVLDADDAVPVEILSHCISMALTYHVRKDRGRNPRHRI